MKTLEAVRITKPANLLLETHLKELGVYFWPEFRFCKERRWRADYAVGTQNKINAAHVLIEIEGGIFTAGRHTRGTGYQKDIEKYNVAIANGFKVFRFSTQDVLSGRAKEFLEKNWLCR